MNFFLRKTLGKGMSLGKVIMEFGSTDNDLAV